MSRRLSTLELVNVYAIYCEYLSKKVKEHAENYATGDMYKQHKLKYLIASITGSMTMFAQLEEVCITTDYTFEEIKQNFEKYGIIILRDPTKSKKLLIGCGNSCDNDTHSHIGDVTMNPELVTNPTIVGGLFFDHGIEKYMNDHNWKYKTLASECCTLSSNGYENFKNNIVPNADNIIDTLFETDFSVDEFFYGKVKTYTAGNLFIRGTVCELFNQ